MEKLLSGQTIWFLPIKSCVTLRLKVKENSLESKTKEALKNDLIWTPDHVSFTLSVP